MGYPTSVGVLWHVTDHIAIRPEIDFFRSRITIERSGGLVPLPAEEEDTSSVVRPGVSALFYLGPKQDLRTYVSPRFVFVSTDTSGSDQETDSYLTSGSFGGQYWLGRRFAVFGELGIEWTKSTSRFDSTPITTGTITIPLGTTTLRRTGVSSRSGVGVVLYF
jgi:hypothetical protein